MAWTVCSLQPGIKVGRGKISIACRGVGIVSKALDIKKQLLATKGVGSFFKYYPFGFTTIEMTNEGLE